MRILLNQHLSWKLKARLGPLFEDVLHVRDLGLSRAADQQILEWARQHAYAIVTKDSDYNDLVISGGPPPVVIWLRMGNCSTRQIEEVLIRNLSSIKILAGNSESGIIAIQ